MTYQVNIYSRTHRHIIPERIMGTHMEDIFYSYETASWIPQNPDGVISYKGVPQRTEEEKAAHFDALAQILYDNYYKEYYTPSTPSLIGDLKLKTFVIEENYFKHMENGSIRNILVKEIHTGSDGCVLVDGNPVREKYMFSGMTLQDIFHTI